MRQIYMALPLMALSFPALACPVAEDMAGAGIQITDAEGTVLVYQQISPDAVGVTVDYGDSTGMYYTAHHGLYTLETTDTEGGQQDVSSTVRMSYEGGLETLAVPTPDMDISLRSGLDAGSIQTDWQLAYSFGALENHEIDGCTFQTIMIEVAMQGPLGPVQQETYRFFVDFGFAHLAASGVGTMVFETQAVSITSANQ